MDRIGPYRATRKLEQGPGSTLESLQISDTLPKPAVLLHLLNQVASSLDSARNFGMPYFGLSAQDIWITEGTTWADYTADIAPGPASRRRHGSVADRSSNLHSLAAIVYQLLAGSPPFLPNTGSHSGQAADQAIHLDQLNKTVNTNVDLVVRRALATSDGAQFATCVEFVQDLSAALAQCPGWRPMSVTRQVVTRSSTGSSKLLLEASNARSSRPVTLTFAALVVVGLITFATTRAPMQAVKQTAAPQVHQAVQAEPKQDPPQLTPAPQIAVVTPPAPTQESVAPLVPPQRKIERPKPIPNPQIVAPRREIAPQLKKPQGTMVLTSVPAGAEVKVDGVSVGTTPVTLHLKIGIHRLQLISLGRSHNESVFISGDGITTRAVNWEQ